MKSWQIAIQILVPASLVSALAYWALGSNWGALSSLSFSPAFFLVGLVLGLLWVWTQAILWHRLLDPTLAGASTQFARNTVFAQAWLMRYVPGKIPALIALSYIGTRLGHKKQSATQSALMLTLFTAGGNLLIGSLALAFFPDQPSFLLPGTLLALGFVILALVAGLRSELLFRIVRFAYHRWTKRTLQQPLALDRKSLLATSGTAILAGLLIGVAYVAVLRSITPELSLGDVLYVVALSNLAIASGTVAIFAPNGLGVREIVLVGGIVVVTSPAIGLAWALLTRLAVLFADFGFLGTSMLVERGRRRSSPPPNTL